MSPHKPQNKYDWKNQNRVFPGKIKGSMTERIAYQISKEVIDQCDYLIDMHCGDGNEDLMPYLYYTKTGDEALDSQTRELAINFGFKVIIHESVKPNESSASHCANSALLKGKPARTIESGKLGKTDEEDIIRITQGTYNTLKHLNMIPGSPELLFEPVWVKSVTYIRSEHKGIFYPLSHSGRHVRKGELLGYLNRVTVQAGLQLMSYCKDTKGKSIPARHFKNFAQDNEDAETADVFMQLSVMGEIVYG